MMMEMTMIILETSIGDADGDDDAGGSDDSEGDNDGDGGRIY